MRSKVLFSLLAGVLLSTGQPAWAADHLFTVTDIPGHWYDAGADWNVDSTGARSLIVASPGDTIHFKQRNLESYHTVTSLVWPTAALDSEKIDQDAANKDDHELTLTTTGLYVFVCKLHPYMLGAVIVDNGGTAGLDLGDAANGQLTIAGTSGGTFTFQDTDDIAARLLRAFYIVTNPANWKDYTQVGQPYQPLYPSVNVRANTGGGATVDLKAYLLSKNYDGANIPAQVKPSTKAVGSIWVDTAYELTEGKDEKHPGTITVVNGSTWNIARKIALPKQKMNNGHNFWTSHNQNQVYQTEWHGNSVYVINRLTGKLIQEITEDAYPGLHICHNPAHVMTRVDTQQVHWGCNGDDYVAEFNKVPLSGGRLKFNRLIPMSTGIAQTQPHAHWMGFDGKSMVTPNSNSGDSTLYSFTTDTILNQKPTGALPIATGMMPDSSLYYVSNYLGDTISVMCGQYPPTSGTHSGCVPGTKLTDINLLQGYNTVTGTNDGSIPGGVTTGPYGGFSVQTAVSPDGKFVIQGNTLSGTITIIDVATDTLVRSIPCDPGCHGVNFGAKKGGGYYAYITSKFANRLIVLDYDPDNNGDVSDATIAGWAVLAKNDLPATRRDDVMAGNFGQGGQGIMAIPNVYNGWVQKLPGTWKIQLTPAQRNPIAP